MGGGQSTEQDVYNVIRWVPGVGQVYSLGRAVATAAQGEDQQAIDSALGALGIPGLVVLSVRDSDMFDDYDAKSVEWIGNRRQATTIPANFFQGHLFERSSFMYFFQDGEQSNELRKLFDLSADDITFFQGEHTNIPAFRNGSTEYRYYDAINERVVLTSYLVAYSSKSDQCAVFVRTFSFHGSSIFNWSRLEDTKREDLEGILRKFRDAGRKINSERMQALQA